MSSVISTSINEAYLSLSHENREIPPTVNSKSVFISTEANAAYATSALETVYEECNPVLSKREDETTLL